jgi:excisionase family DNA binding protein
MLSDIFTAQEAADYLRLHRDTLYRLCKRNLIRHSQHGDNGQGHYLFRKEWLDAWLDEEVEPLKLIKPKRRARKNPQSITWSPGLGIARWEMP